MPSVIGPGVRLVSPVLLYGVIKPSGELAEKDDSLRCSILEPNAKLLGANSLGLD